jgi:hypothetical protein
MNSTRFLSNKEIWPHIVVLLACSGILAGAWLLTPPDERGGNIQLFGINLPNVCSFQRHTGLPCPGCGLTHSLTEIMHGRISKGFDYHSLGLPTFVYIMLQTIYRGAWLAFPRRRKILEGWGFYLNHAFIYLAILYGLNWIHRLLETKAVF